MFSWVPVKNLKRIKDMVIDGNRLKDRALTKLWIAFKDGKTKTFYSLDKKVDLERKNIFPGIKKIEKLLNNWQGNWKNAIVYEMKTNQEIKKYESN